MKRGCTQCGECLNVCPVFALFKREEYAPKGKRLLMEPLDGWGSEEPMPWKTIRDLSRLCAGCERCKKACARKLSTSDLLAEVRASHPHWSQYIWDIWIRRAGPLWPTAGRLAAMFPEALTPEALQSSLETARAMVDNNEPQTWFTLRPDPDWQVPTRPVVVFGGCTARNIRPQWIHKANALLKAWGYQVIDKADFTCCGGTLHHAGMFKTQAEVQKRNVERWKALGKPILAVFCASCKHSLEGYADQEGLLDADDATLWRASVKGLSALLEKAVIRTLPAAPSLPGYHQPCHWGDKDPDWPFLQRALPGLTKGTALCCGMGGILKMSDPDISAQLGKKCLAGFPAACHNIVTGCSGCTMQLASVAPEGVSVRHWLDIVEVEPGL